MVAGSQLIGTHFKHTIRWYTTMTTIRCTSPATGVDALTDAAIWFIDENKDDEKPFFYSCPSWSLISRTALTISRLRMYTKNMVSGYAAGSGCAGKGPHGNIWPGYYGMVKR